MSEQSEAIIGIYEVVVGYAVGLIVTVLTGRGPSSPGSIEFLFLI